MYLDRKKMRHTKANNQLPTFFIHSTNLTIFFLTQHERAQRGDSEAVQGPGVQHDAQEQRAGFERHRVPVQRLLQQGAEAPAAQGDARKSLHDASG